MKTDFFSLLDSLNAAPADERPKLEQAIWASYGTEQAILALDMSQFSLTVRRKGIVAYLAMIRHMQLLTGSCVSECSGRVVKFQADNMMATFGNCEDAIAAAVKINQSLAKACVVAQIDTYSVSIGIDFGRFLLIGEEDCYGDPVNIAYKLAEDLARPHEVLVSKSVRERLGSSLGYPVDEQQVSVSGLEFAAFAVQYASPR